MAFLPLIHSESILLLNQGDSVFTLKGTAFCLVAVCRMFTTYMDGICRTFTMFIIGTVMRFTFNLDFMAAAACTVGCRTLTSFPKASAAGFISPVSTCTHDINFSS